MRHSLKLLTLFLIISGCRQQQQTPSQPDTSIPKVPTIAVTSEPLLEMTKTIVGDFANVLNIVPAEYSSRDWKPSATDGATLQQADLILISGAGTCPYTCGIVRKIRGIEG